MTNKNILKNTLKLTFAAGLGFMASSVASADSTYKVQDNDSLQSIAKAVYGENKEKDGIKAIVKANHLDEKKENKKIKKIKIKDITLTKDSEIDLPDLEKDVTYEVQSGDYLKKIAEKYNVTVEDLLRWNDIENENLIHVGDEIRIQGDASDVHKDDDKNKDQVATVSYKSQNTGATYAVANTASHQVQQAAAPAAGGSVYAQFIAAGGTDAMWNVIVMPESGGNPNAVSPSGYRGLGQTKQAWGTGSVAQQTQGMINYANARYGSVANAVAARQAQGWW